MNDVDRRTSTQSGDDTEAGANEMTSREAVETLVGAVARSGPPWSFVPSDALAGHDAHQAGRRSWPLVLPTGELLGLVVRDPGGPDQNDELITVLLRTVSSLMAAEQSAAEAQQRAVTAEREARLDGLTGLLNRRAWDDALAAESARMRRHGRWAVVVVVDIDRLKEANDTDGHLAGDLLIRCTADGLRHAVRDSDTVARLGGDEFGVLAVDSDPAVPESLVARIEDALERGDVEVSIGAALARPGGSLHRAFDQADRNMYTDKRRRQRARRAEQLLGITDVRPAG